jgi:hypothetical protein
MIEVPLVLFSELMRASEKIAAVERYVKANKYVNSDDVMAILGIEVKKEDVQN